MIGDYGLASPERPDAPSTELERSLFVSGTVIESAERPTAVMGASSFGTPQAPQSEISDNKTRRGKRSACIHSK